MDIEELQEDIAKLEREIKERLSALPAHSANPAMMQEIEELEEELKGKRDKLERLKCSNG
jgi:chromosome segregation ATPase